MLPRDSSVTALSEPLCRRPSREAALTRREKPRAGHRDDDESEEGQVPPQVEQHCQEDPQAHRLGDRAHDAREQERLHRVDVTGDPGQRIAQSPPFEETERRALHMAQEIRSQSQQETFADPGGGYVIGEGNNAGEECEPDVGRGDRQKRLKLRWTSTSSITSLKSQIWAASMTGAMTMNKRISESHLRPPRV
jgi:hypothetical protein